MITVPHQSLRCCWPQEFFKRRLFDRQAENQPYIEWLQASFDDGEEDGDENNEDDDFVDSNEDEDEVDGQGDESKKRDENRNNVRIFMKGNIGDDDTLQYRDQVERVAEFCEQPSIKEPEKHVVLLDDRSNSGTIQEKRGHSRPYPGPLTSKQLWEVLSKEVPKYCTPIMSLEKFTYYIAFQS